MIAARRGRAQRPRPGAPAEQQRRLDQIQLQAQGPLAFGPVDFPPAYDGGPLADRLHLSEDQARRIGVIVDEGIDEIDRAASFPIRLDPRRSPARRRSASFVDDPQSRPRRSRPAGRPAPPGPA